MYGQSCVHAPNHLANVSANSFTLDLCAWTQTVHTIHTWAGVHALFTSCHGRESTQWEHKKMELLNFLAVSVMLSWVLTGTVGTICSILHLYITHCLYAPISIQLVSCSIYLVQVQWSSIRPTQLPLMCVELATSPSGVSMVQQMVHVCPGVLMTCPMWTYPPSQDTLPSLAPPPIRR